MTPSKPSTAGCPLIHTSERGEHAEDVITRNEQGERAKLLHPDFQEVDETVPVDGSAAELAIKYAT